MDFELIAFFIFVAFLSMFLYLKRKNIEIQKIVYPLLYFLMYKTKLGLKAMNKFSKKRVVNWFGNVGVVVGFLGMIAMAFFLVYNIYKIFTMPTAVAGIQLVLPFKTKMGFYVPFFYWIIAIFIIATCHEFMHGVLARKNGLKIKSSGLAFLGILVPILPAAFVEPDEKKMAKIKPWKQLQILAAGPFINILMGGLFIILLLFVAAPIANTMVNPDGIKIMSISKDSPAEKAGLLENSIITQIDEKKINTIDDFKAYLNKKNPEETIKVTTKNGTFDVILKATAQNSSKAYLGIYVSQNTEMKESYKSGIGLVFSNFLLWVFGLFYWLYLLSLGIGAFNLVPLGPIDGGRMVYVLINKYIKNKKKAVKTWSLISLFFLALVLINLFAGFFK